MPRPDRAGQPAPKSRSADPAPSRPTAPRVEAPRARAEASPVRLTRPGSTPSAALPAPVRSAIGGSGVGSPLAPEVARPLGRSLRADLSAVRVHTGDHAAAAAAAAGTRALTWGTDVFLGHGQRATDLPLVAHEVTHAVQQAGGRSGGPAVLLFGGAHGDLEREARDTSAAVVRGEPVAIRGRTAVPAIQRDEESEHSGGVWDAALAYVRDKARSIPGYELLGVILGRDPISQQPIARTATNLIRGALSFVSGGAEMFDNLMRADVVQRAFAWFETELDKLGLTWPYVRGLFGRAWDALRWYDVFQPGRAWEKLREVFGPPLSRIRDFAVAAGRKVPEFIFEGALALAGGAGQQVLAIFRRVGAVFNLVVADPIGFLRNLLGAAMGGFRQFGTNILTHLKTGIIEWLVGGLRGIVRLPARWDFAGILGLILQILGLTYDALRAALVKIVGEPAVRYAETAFDFLRTVVTGGLAAAWEKIKEFAGNLADTVLAGIRDWVARSVVGAAITKIVTMFNPVGAIIQAVITTYNTVMFFVERAQQIGRLLGAVMDSIEAIARGNTASAANFVERTMANALPVILGFLARMVGLGDVAAPVRQTIERVRAAIMAAVLRIANWVATRIKGLLARRAGGAAAPGSPSASDKAAGGVRDIDRPTSIGQERHTLRAHVEGRQVRVLMASERFEAIGKQLRSLRVYAENDLRSRDADLRTRSINLNHALDGVEARAAKMSAAVASAPDAVAVDRVVANGLDDMQVMLSEITAKFGLPGLQFVRPAHLVTPSKLDTYGRATAAAGDPLSRASSEHGSPAASSMYITGIHLIAGLQRGHLVADLLGGEGNIRENLTPLTGTANTAMKKPERAVANFIYKDDPTNRVSYLVRVAPVRGVDSFQTWLRTRVGSVPPNAAHQLFTLTRAHSPTDGEIRTLLTNPALTAAQCALVRHGIAYHLIDVTVTIEIVATPGPANKLQLPKSPPPIANSIPTP